MAGDVTIMKFGDQWNATKWQEKAAHRIQSHESADDVTDTLI